MHRTSIRTPNPITGTRNEPATNSSSGIMRPIPDSIKRKLEAEPNVCALRNYPPCGGRITWEHAIIYAGKQVNEVWAIIKICECHHGVNTYQDGGNFNKELNVWVALNRATDDELRAISKTVDYLALRTRLNTKYGNI